MSVLKQQTPRVIAATPARSTMSAQALLVILDRTQVLYAQLIVAVRARRDAIKCADFNRFSQLGMSEARIVAEISELDIARLAQARALATRLALPPEATLAQISPRLSLEEQARLDLVRSELRILIDQTKSESSVVRQAAERLSAHMAGILQTVHSALAHANVYSRGGRIAVGANVISSLDIRS